MTRSALAFVVAALVVASCGSGSSGTVSSSEPSTTASASTTATETTATTAVEATTTSPALGAGTSTIPAAAARLVVSDAAYAPLSAAQRLDVYLPAAVSPPTPVVVFIHGGAWSTGDKRAEYAAAVVPILTSAGYAVASINYRLSGEATFPAQLLDVKAAVRWLRANASRYGLDPDRFAAVGESAGAHLAALLGTTAGEASFDDAALGNGGMSSEVQAVIDWYGPVDLSVSEDQLAANPACAGQLREPGQPDPAATLLLGAPPATVPDRARAANPITYITPGRSLPPFLIAHGDHDCVVPYQGSVALHEALQAAGGPSASRLVIVPGSGHYDQFDAAGQLGNVLVFLAETLGGAPA